MRRRSSGRGWRVGLLLLAGMPLCSGCALSPGDKLAACQAEKQVLLARIEQDQHKLQLFEARAHEAERQLARLHDRGSAERLAALPDDSPTPLYTPPDASPASP